MDEMFPIDATTAVAGSGNVVGIAGCAVIEAVEARLVELITQNLRGNYPNRFQLFGEYYRPGVAATTSANMLGADIRSVNDADVKRGISHSG